jgi:hypothetical protein
MRRSLALAAVAAVAFAAPASAAQQIPPRPLEWCDVTQNCLCLLANYPYYVVTGDSLLTCV